MYAVRQICIRAGTNYLTFRSHVRRYTDTSGPYSNLKNKVALVTGCTSGIGLGVTKCLASKGCHVVFTGLGEPDEIDRIQEDVRSRFGVDVHYVAGNLTEKAGIRTLCDGVDRHFPRGIDILVNNAGFQHVCEVENFPDDKWDQLMAVMLTAPFMLIRHFLPRQKAKGWGRIINLASVHGVVASPKKAGYVSAKHGVLGLTKVVALETATTGVTCNAICPGFVDTPIFRSQVQMKADSAGLTYDEAKKVFLKEVHPTLDVISIEQVAEFVAFVCSSSADQMTGSILTMDCGWTAR